MKNNLKKYYYIILYYIVMIYNTDNIEIIQLYNDYKFVKEYDQYLKSLLLSCIEKGMITQVNVLQYRKTFSTSHGCDKQIKESNLYIRHMCIDNIDDLKRYNKLLHGIKSKYILGTLCYEGDVLNYRHETKQKLLHMIHEDEMLNYYNEQ